MLHQINIIIHIAAGSLALIAGVVALCYKGGSYKHISWGYSFLCLLGIVVSTGFIGWLFFRSNSFLLMLTILSGYTGFTGWRIIKLRENKPSILDLGIAIIALLLGMLFLFYLRGADGNWNPAVIYSTLGALTLVTVYDISKFLFLHRYIKTWWLYEHIYKMVSAFSAIFSAFVGTVLPHYKPYSQVGPSTLCILFIVIMIWRRVKKRKKISLHIL